MRVGYKYVPVGEGGSRTKRDTTAADFAESVGVRQFPSREAFLEYAYAGQAAEVHAALRRLLDRDRSILSVASGPGLFEVPPWARPRVAGRRPGEPRWIRKQHADRRTDREVAAAARAHGFAVGRTIPYGYALELLRVGLDLRAPSLYRLVERACRRLGYFHYGTVVELLSR